MTSLYWICLLLGGGVVILQLLASLIGLEGDAPHDIAGHDGLSEGLHLFSVRAVSAGVAFFGVGGLAGRSMGLPAWMSIPLAVVAGLVAAFGVAALMNSMRRLERDQTLQLANAVGLSGEVYLSIPAQQSGLGKIHITIQERLVELTAITREDALSTGTRILVIDTIEPDTVVVIPQPRILEDPERDD